MPKVEDWEETESQGGGWGLWLLVLLVLGGVVVLGVLNTSSKLAR